MNPFVCVCICYSTFVTENCVLCPQVVGIKYHSKLEIDTASLKRAK